MSVKGCEVLYTIGDAILVDTTLEQLAERFMPLWDLYYFEDDHIYRYLLDAGIPVYTRAEFSRSFPRFSLDYGALYQMFDLSIPDVPWVTLLRTAQWWALGSKLQVELMEYQIRCGRGNIYEGSWFSKDDCPVNNTVTVNGRWCYLLTAEDWQAKGTDDRKQWVLKWLVQWHTGAPLSIRVGSIGGFERVPYRLIHEYAGTFAHQSGPNCFAAAIAMVVGGSGVDYYPQSRDLITQWLHQEPFFRLLDAQRYQKVIELRTIDPVMVQPADVLIWCTSDGAAKHAAFAITPDAVFQKEGQGWESPWLLVQLNRVRYNEYLKSGGHVAVYRRQ